MQAEKLAKKDKVVTSGGPTQEAEDTEYLKKKLRD